MLWLMAVRIPSVNMLTLCFVVGLYLPEYDQCSLKFMQAIEQVRQRHCKQKMWQHAQCQIILSLMSIRFIPSLVKILKSCCTYLKERNVVQNIGYGVL